ncbi:gem-associated protein 2 [Microplitis mediator]|uniref:gem-associated protein 2 n=1 Tax=Microplitis mediator TaxID=375433 RepID=UPI002552FB14|nr:gem-associated protein 2 [Microplitis mediator]
MTESFREPALFVGDIDEEIDFSKPPNSGEEYIKRVVVEAKQCDDIVVANIDSKKLKKPTVDVEHLAGCVEAPETLCPTLEWQNCQVADFSKLRLNVAGLKIERENCRSKKKSISVLPDADDQTDWINFCLGSADQDPHVPTLDIIFSMNQPLVEQVLEYLVEQVDTKGLSSELGRWIYALLSVLEIPLNPDICSCLRTLARACSRARANLASSDDSIVSTMNLFICLVARYFRQLDLADP